VHPYKCPDIPSSQPNRLLSAEALERAQTLRRQIADLAFSRRQLLQIDPRRRVPLSIVGVPRSSYSEKIYRASGDPWCASEDRSDPPTSPAGVAGNSSRRCGRELANSCTGSLRDGG
jgi:hypothetical protein